MQTALEDAVQAVFPTATISLQATVRRRQLTEIAHACGTHCNPGCSGEATTRLEYRVLIIAEQASEVQVAAIVTGVLANLKTASGGNATDGALCGVTSHPLTFTPINTIPSPPPPPPPPAAPCKWHCYVSKQHISTGPPLTEGERDHSAWHIVENARAAGLLAFQYETADNATAAHGAIPMASPIEEYAYRRKLGDVYDAEQGPSELQSVEQTLDGRAVPAPVRADIDSHEPSQDELRALYEMEERVYGHTLTQAEYRAQRENRHRRLVGEDYHEHDDDDATDDHGETELHDGDTGDVACVCEPYHPTALELSPPASPGCNVPTTNEPANLEFAAPGVTKCPHLDPEITASECDAFYYSLPNYKPTGGMSTINVGDRKHLNYYHGCQVQKAAASSTLYDYAERKYNEYGGTREDLSNGLGNGGTAAGWLLVCRRQFACAPPPPPELYWTTNAVVTALASAITNDASVPEGALRDAVETAVHAVAPDALVGLVATEALANGGRRLGAQDCFSLLDDGSQPCPDTRAVTSSAQCQDAFTFFDGQGVDLSPSNSGGISTMDQWGGGPATASGSGPNRGKPYTTPE